MNFYYSFAKSDDDDKFKPVKNAILSDGKNDLLCQTCHYKGTLKEIREAVIRDLDALLEA